MDYAMGATAVIVVGVVVSVVLGVALWRLLRRLFHRMRLWLAEHEWTNPVERLQQHNETVVYWTGTCYEVGMTYLEMDRHVISAEDAALTDWERTQRTLLEALEQALRLCNWAVTVVQHQRRSSRGLVRLRLALERQQSVCAPCHAQQQQREKFFCPLAHPQNSSWMNSDGDIESSTDS